MKRISNVYSNIYDTSNIINIYKSIKSKVRNKKRIENFENNYTMNISYIKYILENKKYIVGKYNIFLIKKPKYRIIMSQNMIDKIISHLLSKYILIPYLEKSLIDTNVATRINKGTSYGIKILKRYLNKVNNNYYCLKFDISKYFYNIDHNILKYILKRKIKDKDVINVLYKLIDSTNDTYINKRIDLLKQKEIDKIRKSNLKNKNRIIKEINDLPKYKYGKGLSIGSMLNQFLGIYYLNELDHFIKEKLNIKYYIRYMDDGLIIHQDKEYLIYCLRKIEIMLKKYKLKYNYNKTKVKFKKRLKLIKNINDIKSINKLLCGYIGHLSYCTSNINCWRKV